MEGERSREQGEGEGEQLKMAEPAGFVREVDWEGLRREKDAALDAVDDAILHGGNRSRVLQVSPGEVSFAGYEVGRKHCFRFNVVNVSEQRQRVHIHPPRTKEFKITYDKKGVLAPGMSETIIVYFKTDGEMCNYQDRVRIDCGDEKIIVPLNAFPVLSKSAIFPRLIDFGVCALNQKHTRKEVLECNLPVGFDFEISLLTQRSEFSVFPLTGKIPANGRVEIQIDFTPRHLTVASFAFRLSLSQFGFQPITCTVVGSSCPGKMRASLIEQDEAKFSHEIDEDSNLSLRVKTAVKGVRFDGYEQPKVHRIRGVGSGAVHDPGAEALEEREKSRRQKRAQNNQAEEVARNEGEEEDEQEKDIVWMNGIKVPLALEGVQATNYVLTQEPGMLKPKDLKKAIAKHRARRERERKEQELAAQKLITSGGGDGDMAIVRVDPVQVIVASDQAAVDQSTTRQVKEMVFLQQVIEVEEQERARAFSNQAVHVGDTPLDQAQVDEIKESRKLAVDEMERGKRMSQRETWVNELAGPASIPPVRVKVRSAFDDSAADADANAAPEGPETLLVIENPRAPSEGEETNDTEEYEEKEGEAEEIEEKEETEQSNIIQGPDVPEPTFNFFENDVWRRRKLVQVRFSKAVGKLIIQNRAKRRIAAIWTRLGDARTRKAVRALVDEDTIKYKLTSGLGADKSTGTEEEPEWKRYRQHLQSVSARHSRNLSTREKIAQLALPPPEQDDKGEAKSEEGEAENEQQSQAQAAHIAQSIAPPPFPGTRAKPQENPASEAISRGAILDCALKDQNDLHLVSFPLYHEATTLLETAKVESAPIKGFQDLGLFRLRVPDEYRLCGYSKFALPKVPQYVPKFDQPQYRQGALHESSWREPESPLIKSNADNKRPACGESAVGEDWIANERKPCFSFVLPSRTLRTFEDTSGFTEFDPEFYLQPRAFAYVEKRTRGTQAAWEVGVSSLRALSREPTISNRWRPNQNPYSSASSSLWDCDQLFDHLLEERLAEDMLSEDEGSDIEQAMDENQAEQQANDTSRQTFTLAAAHSLFLGERQPEGDEDEEQKQDEDHQDQGGDVENVCKQSGFDFSNKFFHKANLSAECGNGRNLRLDVLNTSISKCNEFISDPKLRFNLKTIIA